MPELPDIETYLSALGPRILGQRLETVRIASPFLLRTVDPPVTEVAGRAVADLRRLGKRVVVGLEGDYFLVVHLMIAGRLWWKADLTPRPPLRRTSLAAFDFPPGTLLLTEAGT